MRTQILITLAFGALLASVAVVGGNRLSELDTRVRSENQTAVEREAGAAKMARELDRQREDRRALLGELARLEGELERLQGERDQSLLDLRVEFAAAQNKLRDLVTSSTGQLSVLESSVTQLEGAEYSTLIQQLNANVSEKWRALEARLDEADGQLDSTRAALLDFDEKFEAEPDLDAMWNDLMGPVVKLAGADSVGSGVRLESFEVPGGHRTLVLTAWHVVRDILDDEAGLGDVQVAPAGGSRTVLDDAGQGSTVPVTIYDRFGIDSLTKAVLIDFDATLDIALLELTDHDFHPFGAKLAGRESLLAMRVFEPIFAVGCPLGNDPVPSRGEISDTSHYVDGQRYWMINAPTFIGNSGGGIFDGRTHELVGIFSKIYNYGSNQQTIIPHMGLLTPLDSIYDWISVVAPGSLSSAAE